MCRVISDKKVSSDIGQYEDDKTIHTALNNPLAML